MVGDATHQTGVVLAEIVKANIPVRNGVVHLIQRPLMVVDTTVKDFLEVSDRLFFSLTRFPLLEFARRWCWFKSVLAHNRAQFASIRRIGAVSVHRCPFPVCVCVCERAVNFQARKLRSF